jgi:hypothetical protein
MRRTTNYTEGFELRSWVQVGEFIKNRIYFYTCAAKSFKHSVTNTIVEFKVSAHR